MNPYAVNHQLNQQLNELNHHHLPNAAMTTTGAITGDGISEDDIEEELIQLCSASSLRTTTNGSNSINNSNNNSNRASLHSSREHSPYQPPIRPPNPTARELLGTREYSDSISSTSYSSSTMQEQGMFRGYTPQSKRQRFDLRDRSSSYGSDYSENGNGATHSNAGSRFVFGGKFQGVIPSSTTISLKEVEERQALVNQPPATRYHGGAVIHSSSAYHSPLKERANSVNSNSNQSCLSPPVAYYGKEMKERRMGGGGGVSPLREVFKDFSVSKTTTP